MLADELDLLLNSATEVEVFLSCSGCNGYISYLLSVIIAFCAFFNRCGCRLILELISLFLFVHFSTNLLVLYLPRFVDYDPVTSRNTGHYKTFFKSYHHEN